MSCEQCRWSDEVNISKYEYSGQWVNINTMSVNVKLGQFLFSKYIIVWIESGVGKS